MSEPRQNTTEADTQDFGDRSLRLSAAEAHALAAALELAGRGIACFPCRESKAPACSHGFKDATTDSGTLINIWAKHPGVLVGTPTGKVSGFDVLDLDLAKHPEAASWWQANRSRMPQTRTHRTRSGGFHVFFHHAAGLRNSAGKIARGVDVRAAGGYVIWWPAIGLEVVSDAALATWPESLLNILEPPPVPCRAGSIVPDDHALTGLVRAIANAPVGQRNGILFWASCRVGQRVRSKMLDEATALAILQEAGCRAGLPSTEVHRTALSGLRSSGGR